MWLTNSSIGRKVVMAVTGICLVLFVTFHVLMNAVCLVWPAAYNQICMFLGANWYALVASMGLAALFIIHILYAIWLTLQNRKARGTDRYAVTARPPQVEWSSKNMLVLGIVVVAFLVVHLVQFWAKMQLQELLGSTAEVDGMPAAPEFGTLFIQGAFSCIWTPIIYIIGFIALWFHMNHGFWSMFHSIGWDNNIWIKRLKCIAFWWTSIVIGLFIIQAVVFTVQANNKYYLTDPALQEQYAEYWAEQGQKALEEFSTEMNALTNQAQAGQVDQMQAQMAQIKAMGELNTKLQTVVDCAKKQCPDAYNEQIEQYKQICQQLQYQLPAGAPAVQDEFSYEEEAVEVAEPEAVENTNE